MNKGIYWGVMSAILWGLDALLIGQWLGQFSTYEVAPWLVSILAILCHDSVSAIGLGITVVCKARLRQNLFGLSRRAFLVMMGAGVCGGLLGMCSYGFAIGQIGATATATLSSLYPVIGMLVAVLVGRDRLSWKKGVGLLVATGGLILLNGGGLDRGVLSTTGGFVALLCALGWGVECVLVSSGLALSVSPTVALFLRQSHSAFDIALFLWLVGRHEFLSLWEMGGSLSLGWLFLAAVVGTLSYLCYYRAIEQLGPITAMGLNMTYSIWTGLIGFFWLGIPWTISAILASVLMILGVMLTVTEGEKVQ